jgi:hypothetical protein
MHHLSLWLSVRLLQLFLALTAAMAAVLVVGAGIVALYLTSRQGRPHFERISAPAAFEERSQLTKITASSN